MASNGNTIITTNIVNNNGNNNRSSKRRKSINMKPIRENFASATPYVAPRLELLGQPLPPWETAAAKREETKQRLKKELELAMQQLPPYVSIINAEKPPLGHAGSFWGKKIGEWRIKMNLLIDKYKQFENQSKNPFIRPFKRLIGAPTGVQDALWKSIRYGPDTYWVNMNMPESEKYIDYYAEGSDNPSQKKYTQGGRRTKRNKRSARRKTR